MEYYRQSSADTLHALDSTPDGLTQAQADERLARDGHNVLAEPPKPSVVKRFFAQLADPMILVLLAAAPRVRRARAALCAVCRDAARLNTHPMHRPSGNARRRAGFSRENV